MAVMRKKNLKNFETEKNYKVFWKMEFMLLQMGIIPFFEMPGQEQQTEEKIYRCICFVSCSLFTLEKLAQIFCLFEI